LSDLRKYNAEMRRLDEEQKRLDDEHNVEMRKRDEEMRKHDEEMRIQHEQRMNTLKQQNARLAELELKLDIMLQSSDSNLTPTISTDDN
jgi:hypothetical protein